MEPRTQPWIAETAWIAANATVRAHVELGEHVSIWFGAVLRGDSDQIRIGAETNIQDLCCLHADPGFPCVLGERVTVGHGAIVHGAVVEDECLIGIKSIILTGARIGARSIIGAGALVKEGQIIPPGSVAVGTPARVVRSTTDEDIQRILRGAQHYVANAQRYRDEAT